MAFGIIFLAVGIAIAWLTYAYALVSQIWLNYCFQLTENSFMKLKTFSYNLNLSHTFAILGPHRHLSGLCWNVPRRWAALRANLLLP